MYTSGSVAPKLTPTPFTVMSGKRLRTSLTAAAMTGSSICSYSTFSCYGGGDGKAPNQRHKYYYYSIMHSKPPSYSSNDNVQTLSCQPVNQCLANAGAGNEWHARKRRRGVSHITQVTTLCTTLYVCVWEFLCRTFLQSRVPTWHHTCAAGSEASSTGSWHTPLAVPK